MSQRFYVEVRHVGHECFCTKNSTLKEAKALAMTFAKNFMSVVPNATMYVDDKADETATDNGDLEINVWPSREGPDYLHIILKRSK